MHPTVTNEPAPPAGAITPETAEVLARIDEISDVILAHAADGERDRRVAEPVIDALREAGVFRLTVARQYGGYEQNHGAVLEVGRALGRLDGGTAWIAGLIASGTWYTRFLPPQARDEVFLHDPDARVSVVLQPTGTATKVEGGYRVKGQWYYNSGSWHANWALIAVQLLDEDGADLGQGSLLMPATDFTITDVWYVAGMRASGSNRLDVDDAFVPDHRVLTPATKRPGAYNTPYPAASMPLALLGPQLGLGRCVLEHVIRAADTKRVAFTTGVRQADSVAVQMAIAKATMQLNAADLVARQAAAELDAAHTAEAPLNYTTRARVRAVLGYCAELVGEAIQTLLSAHGAAGFADHSPIQRAWRDQSVVERHGYVSAPLSYEIYGKALLGVENVDAPLL